MKAGQATRREQYRARIRDHLASLRAIRHEQSQLVSELVWNEMRISELRSRLDGQLAESRRRGMQLEYERRLSFVESMAQWEQAADRSARVHCRHLQDLLAEDPSLASEFPELAENLTRPGLDDIARSAAADLIGA